MKKQLGVLDLFSGIGGFSLGLERAGMKTLAFCENDKECQKILSKNFKNTYIFDDIRNLKIQKDGSIADHKYGSFIKASDIDVICGGFPCQDISVAGNKKGFEDEEEVLSNIEREFKELFNSEGRISRDSEGDFQQLLNKIKESGRKTKANRTRSGLWEELFRIIKEVKPQYAIIENVANLRSKGLNKIIKDLWKIGYDCEWHIISARSIGAPHLRERVWIIAYPNTDRPKSGVFFSAENKKESIRLEWASEKQSINSSDSLGIGTQISLKGEQSAKQVSRGHGEKGRFNSSNANMPRLWRPFASEEAASGWWTEATASFCDLYEKIYEIEPAICGGHDGLPRGLDKTRKERVRQLGNSVLPQIPELIGRAIIEFENLNE